jgi:hypothetical protein
MPNEITITPAVLDELDALAVSATPRPWKISISDGRMYIYGPQNKEWVCDVGPIDFYISPDNDAAFIVSVCNVYPALSAALRQAWAENEKMKAAIIDVMRYATPFSISEDTSRVLESLNYTRRHLK